MSKDSGAVFDWDGVVIDSHDQHEESWRLLAEELGRPLPDGFFKATFGMRNEQIIPGYTGWVEPDDTARITELGARKEVLYRQLLERDGIGPQPGVRTLLAVLADAGVPCAIGTSTPRINVDVVLGTMGIADRFAAIVSAEDVTRGKPDPQVFLRAAERIGREPARCVVFEDAPAGVEAARLAGMKVIAVTTTHPADSFVGANLVVDSLAEVDDDSIALLLG